MDASATLSATASASASAAGGSLEEASSPADLPSSPGSEDPADFAAAALAKLKAGLTAADAALETRGADESEPSVAAAPGEVGERAPLLSFAGASEAWEGAAGRWRGCREDWRDIEC